MPPVALYSGPRVVCGISTWQYGDDSDEDDVSGAQQDDAQYDNVGGDNGHLEPDQDQDQGSPMLQQQQQDLEAGEIQAATADGADVDRSARDHYNHANPLYGLPPSADVSPDAAAGQCTHVQPVTEAPPVGGVGGGVGGGSTGAQLPTPLRRALALCRAGHGGAVLLDGPTYSATSQEELQEQCMVGRGRGTGGPGGGLG